MRIDILTLFPEMFESYFDASILARAQESGLLQITSHNIRDHATDKHRITDEPPFGGGGGMVLKPEPLFRAVEDLVGRSGGAVSADSPERSAENDTPAPWPIVLLTPQGRLFSHKVANELAQQQRLTLICGRYEGVDERVRRHLVTDEISIGDYVLTGGELAASVGARVVGASVVGLPEAFALHYTPPI